MTVPMEYQHASEAFMRFLADARDEADIATMNIAFTMVDGVLRTFRRRLSPAEALRFAAVLPPVLCALFIAGGNEAPPLPFSSREEMTREVQALRQHHNLAPETAIRDVATALRRHVNLVTFERVLATLSPEAVEFWTGKA